MAYDSEKDVVLWSTRIEEFEIELAVVQYNRGAIKTVICRYFTKKGEEMTGAIGRMLPEELAAVMEALPELLEAAAAVGA